MRLKFEIEEREHDKETIGVCAVKKHNTVKHAVPASRLTFSCWSSSVSESRRRVDPCFWKISLCIEHALPLT